MSEPATDPIHVIPASRLLEMLRRVALGEDPNLVYLEEYANAQREDYREEEAK